MKINYLFMLYNIPVFELCVYYTCVFIYRPNDWQLVSIYIFVGENDHLKFNRLYTILILYKKLYIKF